MPLARIHGLYSCGHIGCPGPSGRASGGWMNATLPLKLPARVPRRSMGFDAASASARPFATEAARASMSRGPRPRARPGIPPARGGADA